MGELVEATGEVKEAVGETIGVAATGYKLVAGTAIMPLIITGETVGGKLEKMTHTAFDLLVDRPYNVIDHVADKLRY